MTLAIGNKVAKLDEAGEPIKDGEAYVEYEVVQFQPPYFNPDNSEPESRYTLALLKVVR